jgi:lipoprotein-anchoring transpeptidase ErfK/SrfK
MYKEYYSKKYDWAPMPYAIFFRGGYAIHGTFETKRLGTVASHGCVRLSPDHARQLYRLVQAHGRGNVSIRVKA